MDREAIIITESDDDQYYTEEDANTRRLRKGKFRELETNDEPEIPGQSNVRIEDPIRSRVRESTEASWSWDREQEASARRTWDRAFDRVTAKEGDIRESIERKYVFAAQTGILYLAHYVLKEELRSSNTLAKLDTIYLMETMFNILGSMEPCVVEHLIRGTIALARRADPLTRKAFLALDLSVRKNSQPAIYYQCLANHEGRGPSPKTLQKVVEMMRRYCAGRPEDESWASKVDGMVGRGDWEGKRRYLWESGDPVSKSRVGRIEEFCGALTKRLEGIPRNQWDEEMDTPLVEIGYARYAFDCLRDHTSHRSSNHIMGLCHAICTLEYGSTYTIERSILYRIWEWRQAVVGEILLTRIGQGYITFGTGFSHHSAGQSNNSSLKVLSEQWDEYTALILDDSLLEESVKEEEERTKLLEIRAKEEERNQNLKLKIKELDEILEEEEVLAHNRFLQSKLEQLERYEALLKERNAIAEEEGNFVPSSVPGVDYRILNELD